jgi:hypothetical protein
MITEKETLSDGHMILSLIGLIKRAQIKKHLNFIRIVAIKFDCPAEAFKIFSGEDLYE